MDFGFYNMDCMEGMAQFPDNYFDLAIVDPPYGIGDFNTGSKNGVLDKRSGKRWQGTSQIYDEIKWNDNIPDQEYFSELKRVSKNHIIFGFQYYIKYLWPELTGVIIHDFKDNSFNMSHADCAITNLQKRTTVFRYLWSGFKKDFKSILDKNRIHPCEKPLFLYRWLLQNYAKEGDKILDTHVGSASSLIACEREGFQYVGFEIDKDYYQDATKRIETFRSQLTLDLKVA